MSDSRTTIDPLRSFDRDTLNANKDGITVVSVMSSFGKAVEVCNK